ncbi:hypothetical protein WA158_003780 [Blastocystis sp. Blastoise]
MPRPSKKSAKRKSENFDMDAKQRKFPEDDDITPEEIKKMTVRQYFEYRAEYMAQMIIAHNDELVKKLKDDYNTARSSALAPYEKELAVPEKSEDIVIRLDAIEGPHKDAVFFVHPKKVFFIRHITIGRSTSDNVVRNGVSLSDDPEVSTTHAKIFLRGKQVILKDTHSMNGTYVNKEMIQDEAKLKNGDEIMVGATVLIVSM